MNVNKALSGGAFSAVFCAIAAPVYFTAHATVFGEYRLADVPVAFLNIAALAFIPAAAFGFVLGTTGAFILGRTSLFGRSGLKRTLVATAVGGVLGCVPPSVPRLIHPAGNGELLPFLPCVIIGIVCALAWALVQIRMCPSHTKRPALR